jgi:hypothetical protein
MKTKKMEETVVDLDFDEINKEEVKFIDNAEEKTEVPDTKEEKAGYRESREDVESCLRKEIVTVRHVNRPSGLVTNPKHILYGGMAENAVRYFTVPLLEKSGTLKNVLTDKEKAYLEEAMGLEYNALSIYRKTDNFWTNYQVRLTKSDTYLDLSIPDDYIKYKVLLANSDMIAPNLETLQDKPKATYQFVLIEEGAEEKTASNSVSVMQNCWKEFDKYEDDADVLKMVIETIIGKPLSSSSKLDSLKVKASDLIVSDPKVFLRTITDPLLKTKVLIRKAVEAGIISRRGDYYFLTEGDVPLCGSKEEPTITVAARYLNIPKNRELKFTIEAKLKI